MPGDETPLTSAVPWTFLLKALFVADGEKAVSVLPVSQRGFSDELGDDAAVSVMNKEELE